MVHTGVDRRCSVPASDSSAPSTSFSHHDRQSNSHAAWTWSPSTRNKRWMQEPFARCISTEALVSHPQSSSPHACVSPPGCLNPPPHRSATTDSNNRRNSLQARSCSSATRRGGEQHDRVSSPSLVSRARHNPWLRTDESTSTPRAPPPPPAAPLPSPPASYSPPGSLVSGRDQEAAGASLFGACVKGDDAALEALLRAAKAAAGGGRPSGLDAPNGTGLSPLCLAAFHGRCRCVELLLAAGASASAPTHNESLSTPLHIACKRGHVDVVGALLGGGGAAGAVDAAGSTPLMEASEHGQVRIVEALLSRAGGRTHVNTSRKDGHTPLLAAVRRRDKDMVQALLNGGADPNKGDILGETPLMEASTSGAVELVSLLLAYGADCNVGNESAETALMRSAVLSDTTTVTRLLQAGANVHASDEELGFTPLLFASSQGRAQNVRALLRAGANINHASSVNGLTALQLAARSGYTAVVETLLQNGANINQCDSKGSTPLIMAAIGGFVPVVEALLRAGASPGAHTYEGYTALSAAAEFGQHAVVDLLASYGAMSRQQNGSAGVAAGVSNGLSIGMLFSDEPQSARRNSLRAKQGGTGTPTAKANVRGSDSDLSLSEGSQELVVPPSMMPDSDVRPSPFRNVGVTPNAKLQLTGPEYSDMGPAPAPRLLLIAMPKPSFGNNTANSSAAAAGGDGVASKLGDIDEGPQRPPVRGPIKPMRSILVREAAPPPAAGGDDGGVDGGAAPPPPPRKAAGPPPPSANVALVVGTEAAPDELASYPGQIVKSPHSSRVRFRDPTEEDILLYELDELEWEAEDEVLEEEPPQGCFQRGGEGGSCIIA